MERFRTIVSLVVFFYFIVSFFSGIYFYGQAKTECIEQNGWFKGLVIGCDVMEGNFGPANPPIFLKSQLKGLFWPFHFFFTSSDTDSSVSNVAEGYPFETSVEEQLEFASNSVNMFDRVKINARCSVILRVNAEGSRRSHPELSSKLLEGSDKLNNVANSAMLMHLIITKDILESTSPIDLSNLRSEVNSEVSKQIAFYETPFNNLLDRIGSGTLKAFNEEGQKTYLKDIETCIYFNNLDYGLAPLEDILERLNSNAF